jgi:hypothetical protein
MKEMVRTLAAGAAGAVMASVVITGAPALADQVAKAAPKNSVTSKSIKNGQVKPADLAANVKASLAKADSALQDIPDNSVTNPKLADNAVGSAEVAADSLTAADLAADSVGNSELANNAVTSLNVTDGSLNLEDVASRSGSATADLGSIAAGACATFDIDTGATILGPTLVSPNFTLSNGLTVTGRVKSGAASNIAVFVCNETGGAIDPINAGFVWAVFE